MAGFKKMGGTRLEWKKGPSGRRQGLRPQLWPWRCGRGEQTVFHNGLEPRRGHCYNWRLMRNTVSIADQRGNNQTPVHFTRDEKVQKRVGWADKKAVFL